MINRRQTLGAGIGAAIGLGVVAGCAKGTPVSPDTKDPDTKDIDPAHLAPFTLNLEAWWYDQPFLERIDLAAKAGFQTAEMWDPVKAELPIKDMVSRAKDAGIKIIHCTLSVPKLAEASRDETMDMVKTSIEQVKDLGADYATIVGHDNIPGKSYDEMIGPLQDRLADIAPLLEDAGIMGCLEPFNPYDHPEHFLHGSKDAVRICREINSPNLKLNWDLFHMQRAEGNVVHNLREGIDQCALIQIADSPARRQPGTGEMNYSFILKEAFKAGFDGPMGLECFPDPKNMDQAVADIAALGASLET